VSCQLQETKNEKVAEGKVQKFWGRSLVKMTTAAKPTFYPARASGSMKITEGGYFVGGQIAKFQSARDLPGHMTMKMRKTGQTTAEEVAAKDLLRELEEKERQHFQQLLKERARGGKLLGVTLPASMLESRSQPAHRHSIPKKAASSVATLFSGRLSLPSLFSRAHMQRTVCSTFLRGIQP
jgi:hypothetical protein